MIELRQSLNKILLLNVDSENYRPGLHAGALRYWCEGTMTVNIGYLLALG